MTNPQAEARLFLYDLANLAKEHWFKADEHWALRLVNDAERAGIYKQYYPTLYITGEAESLAAIAEIMRGEIHLAKTEAEVPDERGASKSRPPA